MAKGEGGGGTMLFLSFLCVALLNTCLVVCCLYLAILKKHYITINVLDTVVYSL